MVLQSPLPDVIIPDGSFAEHCLKRFEQHGAKQCLVDESTGRTYTFSEVRRLSMKCAAGLYKMGVRRGDIVATCCTNSAEYIFVALGTQSCGAAVTTCNPSYTADEIVKQFSDSKPKMVFTDARLLSLIKKVAAEVTSIEKIVAMDDCSECQTLYQLLDSSSIEDFPTDLNASADDVALLPYSSGTTGLPKGVVHTNSTLIATFYIARTSLRLSPNDVAYLILPMFHIYGALISMVVLEQGAKLVLQKRFDLRGLFESIQKQKVTLLYAVPPILVAMDKSPMSSEYDTSSLKRVLCGAAPLPDGISASVINKFKFVLLQAWGMTEGVPFTSTIDISYPIKSVGTLCQNTLLKVLDVETDDELPQGQDGELCVKGPQVMKGYYQNPEATSRCIDADGWIRTGDIGHYDENGFVYVVDRLKELIKCKGFQIAPAELEETILRHPKVADVGVIGVSHSESGEVPKAFVVKKDATLTEEELHEFLKDKVAKFKQLAGGIEFVSAIPKTGSGKILRRNLRKL